MTNGMCLRPHPPDPARFVDSLIYWAMPRPKKEGRSCSVGAPPSFCRHLTVPRGSPPRTIALQRLRRERDGGAGVEGRNVRGMAAAQPPADVLLDEAHVPCGRRPAGQVLGDQVRGGLTGAAGLEPLPDEALNEALKHAFELLVELLLQTAGRGLRCEAGPGLCSKTGWVLHEGWLDTDTIGV